MQACSAWVLKLKLTVNLVPKGIVAQRNSIGGRRFGFCGAHQFGTLAPRNDHCAVLRHMFVKKVVGSATGNSSPSSISKPRFEHLKVLNLLGERGGVKAAELFNWKCDSADSQRVGKRDEEDKYSNHESLQHSADGDESDDTEQASDDEVPSQSGKTSFGGSESAASTAPSGRSATSDIHCLRKLGVFDSDSNTSTQS